MFRVEKSEWVQGFQCPSCKEGKNIEEGDRELITTGGIIGKFVSSVICEMYWIARLDYKEQ